MSSVKSENYGEAIENILLIAKCQNRDCDIKEIIAQIKEPDYSILEQVCEEKPVTILDRPPL